MKKQVSAGRKNQPFRYFSCLLFCVSLTPALFLRASAGAGAVPKAAGGPQGEARTAQAARVDRGPLLNGTLDDPLWQTAKVVTDFRQREPNEGDAAPEKTEVRIL